MGFIAQEVEILLESHNFSTSDFAGFIKSPRTEIYTEVDEFGNEVEKFREIEGEYIYGLRYEEFIALLYRYVQIKEHQRENDQEELLTRIEALEKQLKGESK